MKKFVFVAAVCIQLASVLPVAHADTLLFEDTTTTYSIATPGAGPCIGDGTQFSCAMVPAFNGYGINAPFTITRVVFNWKNSGGNNCDGLGNYGAIISSAATTNTVIATSTNSAYLGCAGFSGGTHDTAQLDFTGQVVSPRFYLTFGAFDGIVQGGSAITVSDVRIYGTPVNTDWTQLTPLGVGGQIAMSYDSIRHQLILVAPTGDTFAWNGTSWTIAGSGNGPQSLGSGMAFDSKRGEIVLFGGHIRPPGGTFGPLSNQTWIWNGTTWTQKFPQTSPSPRSDMGMVFDEQRGVIMLFGPGVGDTWTWDGTNWHQETPVHSPSGRSDASMSYDPIRGTTILFGGIGMQGRNVLNLNDTWIWDGTDWTQQFPVHSPSGRNGASMAFDRLFAEHILFGGQDNNNTYLDETWIWDGTDWTQLFPAHSPGNRAVAGISYDTDRNQILLFGGGTNFSSFRDLWAWGQSSQPDTGTISVTTNNPSATFTLLGPATFSGAGLSFIQSNAPAGTYTINFDNIPGYIMPPSQTLTLTGGSALQFVGTYTPIPISISPGSLSFSYRAGTTVPIQAQDIMINSSPAVQVSVVTSTISGGSWLSVTPSNGVTPLKTHVNIADGLHPGQYAGEIIVFTTSGVQAQIAVNLTVTPTMSFTLIFANTSDGLPPSSQHTPLYFTDLIAQLRAYHLDNSYGLVDLSIGPTLDNNGVWYTVGPLSTYHAKEDLFVNDVMTAAGLSSNTISTDGVIIVHGGPRSQTADTLKVACSPQEQYFCTQTGLFPQTKIPWILVSEDDFVGAWAHEIGHDLGLVRMIWTENPIIDRLPHPTRNAVGCWDLMAFGGWGSGSSSCNSGTIPSYMSSLSRATLGIIDYDRVPKDEAIGEHLINSLETSDRFQKVLNITLNASECYVAEVRDNDNTVSRWDISAPRTGLLLYDISTKDDPSCGILTLGSQGDSAQTVNIRAVLNAPGIFFNNSTFKDYSNGLIFKAITDGFSGAQYSVRFNIGQLTNSSPKGLFGILMNGGTLFKKAASFFSDIPPVSPIQLPDLDLHVYTDDGRHVGLNYATGQFENDLSADVSGDQFNGQEWIVLPVDSEGIHFIISGFKTLQFIQEFPELQTILGSTDEANIAAITAVAGGSEAISNKTLQEISPSGWTEIPVGKTVAADGTISVVFGLPKITIDSLSAELISYGNLNEFKNAGVVNGLMAKLRAAKQALSRNDTHAALGELTAFTNQILADNIVVNDAVRNQLLVDAKQIVVDLR